MNMLQLKRRIESVKKNIAQIHAKILMEKQLSEESINLFKQHLALNDTDSINNNGEINFQRVDNFQIDKLNSMQIIHNILNEDVYPTIHISEQNAKNVISRKEGSKELAEIGRDPTIDQMEPNQSFRSANSQTLDKLDNK